MVLEQLTPAELRIHLDIETEEVTDPLCLPASVLFGTSSSSLSRSALKCGVWLGSKRKLLAPIA